ncbi:hypothetical protein P885DRAFT_62710 [Corynascus similis CBS 632.67]
MLRALSHRFVPNKVTATRRYKKPQLTLKAVAADEQALPRFIGKKMRWARGTMMQAYGDMDLDIQRVLGTRSRSYEDYMRVGDETRALLFQSAQAEYSGKSASNAFSHFKSDGRYLSEKIADSRKALRFGKPFEKHARFDYDRDREREHRKEEYKRFRMDHNKAYQRDEAHVAVDSENGNAASQPSAKSATSLSDDHYAHITRPPMYRHTKVCAMRPMPKNELRHRHNLLNAERRTYGFCETRLLSRNELFKHLKTCEAAGQGTIRHPGALSTSVDKDHIEDIMPDGNSGDNALHASFAQLNIPDGEF